MDIIGMLKGMFDATAAIFGYARDRQNLKNAPDVKGAAVAQDEIDAKNRTEQAIARRDIEQLRKDLAE